MTSREGGCLCGAVRYRVSAAPQRNSVCHCTVCQKRTGSAFGFGAYFRDEHVEILRGVLRTHERRSDETGRWLRFEFCVECGVTVTWTIEALPGMRAIGVGTLDDPKWIRPERHVWMRSAHDWLAPPEGVPAFPASALPPK